jgi:hypothetical protein
MSTSPSPSRRPGRIPIAIAALLAVAGLAACGHSQPGHGRGPTSPTTMPPAPAPRGPGPARPYIAGADLADLTSDGAVAAAVGFVTNGQVLLDMDQLDAEQTVRDHAAAATVDEQVNDLRRLWADIHRALAGGTGPIRFWQAPLATRVDDFAPPRARVSVWHVGVLSRAGVAPPQAGWAISVVDLVWEQGGWKLERETATAGPTPILDASAAPATTEQFEAALSGFHRRVSQ